MLPLPSSHRLHYFQASCGYPISQPIPSHYLFSHLKIKKESVYGGRICFLRRRTAHQACELPLVVHDSHARATLAYSRCFKTRNPKYMRSDLQSFLSDSSSTLPPLYNRLNPKRTPLFNHTAYSISLFPSHKTRIWWVTAGFLSCDKEGTPLYLKFRLIRPQSPCSHSKPQKR